MSTFLTPTQAGVAAGHRYTISLAGPQDDATLRHRLARDVMQGELSFTLRRKPSYFSASRLQGDDVDVIVAREQSTGRIVGMGSRCVGTAFVNGAPTRVAHLCDLRIDAAHRGGTLVARIYRKARELHALEPLPTYSLINADNQAAMAHLIHGRAGLPAHRLIGKMNVLGLQLGGRQPNRIERGLELRRAVDEELPEIIGFLNEQRARRFGATVLGAGDFLTGGRCDTLRARDFLVARRGGRLCATLAMWDQSALRQVHVESYPATVELLRPLHNLLARLRKRPLMPAPGGSLGGCYLAFFEVKDSDLELGRLVLRQAVNDLSRGPWPLAVASLHEADPLAPLLREYPGARYQTCLFQVHFDADRSGAQAHSDVTLPAGVELAMT